MLRVEVEILDDERTSSHAVTTERKQSPTGACTRHRYGFAFKPFANSAIK